MEAGPTPSAQNATGYSSLLYAGSPTAGTTNDIAGGHLYLAPGAGKGTGAGGDVIFRVAEAAAASGSTINAYSTAAIIKSTGNVGIGVTSPDAKLHVMGTTGLPATSGATFTGTMRLGVSGGYGTVMDFGAVGPSTGTQWIQVTDSSNQALHYPLLLQPNGGNVGIGTTAPVTKLDISVTPSAPWMKLINADETNFNLTTYNNGTNNGSSVYAFKYGLYYGTTENAAVTFL